MRFLLACFIAFFTWLISVVVLIGWLVDGHPHWMAYAAAFIPFAILFFFDPLEDADGAKCDVGADL